MRIHFFIIMISAIAVLSSCNKNSATEIPVQELKKDKFIDQLNDSTFFSDIRSLFFYKNNFFASDYNRDNVFILDKNLELQKTLGSKGQGPGEFLGASHLFVLNDSIFAYNDAKGVFEVLGYKGHLGTVKIPKDIGRMNGGMRFCLYNDKVFIPNSNSESSIVSFSLKSDSIIRFGNVKQMRNPKETRIKNHRHLNIIGDRVVAISDCFPHIEIYDIKGSLLLDYNLENIGLIKNVSELNKKKEINSYYSIVQDIYILKNKIFILALSIDENNETNSNKIIELELVNNKKIIPKRILDLGNGWFDTFCVTGEKILAYNGTSNQLVLYDYE